MHGVRLTSCLVAFALGRTGSRCCRRRCPFTAGGRRDRTRMNAESVKFHVIGDAYVDFFCFLDGEWPENGGDSRLDQPVRTYAGGSSTNTATHLKSLLQRDARAQETAAAQVELHTVLNPDDHYGDILVKHAGLHGFPIRNCRKQDDRTTGHCIAIVSGGERSFMTHQGCMDAFGPEDLDLDPIVLGTAADIHVHFAGYFNMPRFWFGKLAAVIQDIRRQRRLHHPEHETTVSLVTQHDATRQWDGGIAQVLPLLDFVIMNDLEADHIVAGRSSAHAPMPERIRSWAQHFAEHSRTTNVIVTQGREGAVALRNGTLLCQQISRGVEPIDPTGAGDSFTAGFLYGIWSWRKTHSCNRNSHNSTTEWSVDALWNGLNWGCAVGGAAVMIRGASIPATPEQIESFRVDCRSGNAVDAVDQRTTNR